MPRANRHVVQGQVWHVTHRCHKQAWLLKFARDRKRWIYWLFQAKKRFGLVVLNYVVTSNHVHILVQDQGRREIPVSMQLIAGRTAWEYNHRKNRRGAFWEDRYNATAVESESHLWRCMTYIDLNMVRAGAVNHPEQWRWSGFHELHNPRIRGGRLSHTVLLQLLAQPTLTDLQRTSRQRISNAIIEGKLNREAIWTNSIAVGHKAFVEKIQAELNPGNPGCHVYDDQDTYFLRESAECYVGCFDA